MKNREKFADKIIDFACNSNDSIAVDNQGEVVSCNMTDCKNCKFNTKNCKIYIKKWLEEEYVEPLMISRKDAHLLECVKDCYKYIARDFNKKIFIYINKPEKDSCFWVTKLEDESLESLESFDVYFPMIKWEDEEPWLIDDLKKLKVCENYEQQTN